MSEAHEALVARCRLHGCMAGGDPEFMDEVVRAVIAEVARTLRDVTPEMVDAGWIDKEDVSPEEIFDKMLDASPLTPRAALVQAAPGGE